MLAKVLGWVFTFAIVRAIASIGIGIITYAGVIYAINNAITYARAAYNEMPAGVLQFLGLAGMPEVLGIILGAVVARASLVFARRLAFLA